VRRTEEQPARQLLRNLLVWTAAGREEAGLTLVGNRRIYEEGERIRFEARWRDIRGEPVSSGRLALELRAAASEAGAGADSVSRRYTLSPVPGRAGTSEVVLPPLPPGRYEVRPVAGGDDETTGAWQPLVVATSSLERSQVRQDRRHLRQLAGALGGTYYDGSQDGAVAALLADLERCDLAAENRRLRLRWDLWASWLLLALAAGLLSTEWVLRRRNGLL
jgi:hypothetical protein